MENKLPRKLKKILLGRKIRRRELRLLLKTVTLVKCTGPTMYSHDWAEFSPFEFCPKCGCVHTTSIDHCVEYPEHWEEYFCLRCGYKVGEIDNSPFYHVLEEVIKERDCKQ